jgi:hypothetical protein
MLKGRILFLAMALVAVTAMIAVPASAFENEFGGYWRFRAYSQNDFNGENDAADIQRADSRTRLYYTAKFSDDFKFVNKFEMDAIYGDNESDQSYGDIGADAIGVEVKNSYADFTLMDNLNFKVGTQGGSLARGFFFADDFSGATITYNTETASFPFMWMKINEGHVTATGEDANDEDKDLFAFAPVFSLNNLSLNPWVAYVTQDSTEQDIYVIGADADLKMDMLSAWFTGIYMGGDFSEDLDQSAYLLAAGGSLDMGMFSPHFEAFYATGDDDPTDDENEFFSDVTTGQSYYWSEIQGFGIIDCADCENAAGDNINNIWAANLGVTVYPTDKLSLAFDLWYSELAEDDAFGNSDLGTEVNVSATYQIMDNLALDVVGAYLFAGDVVSLDGENDEDPFELGTRLSLSF